MDMKKKFLKLTPFALGLISAVSLSLPLGLTAYALPAEAIPETPSLTYGDGLERVPTPTPVNPGPFPLQVENWEEPTDSTSPTEPTEPKEPDVSENTEPTDPTEGNPSEAPPDSNIPTASGPETSETPETPETPDTPEPNPADPSEPSDPTDPTNPDTSENLETPTDPISPDTPNDADSAESPSIQSEALAADVAAIRESLGVYIENQRPFFADDVEKQSFFDNLAAIRRALDILLYAVIPISAAVLVIYKICIWFYCTFVKSALE